MFLCIHHIDFLFKKRIQKKNKLDETPQTKTIMGMHPDDDIVPSPIPMLSHSNQRGLEPAPARSVVVPYMSLDSTSEQQQVQVLENRNPMQETQDTRQHCRTCTCSTLQEPKPGTSRDPLVQYLQEQFELQRVKMNYIGEMMMRLHERIDEQGRDIWVVQQDFSKLQNQEIPELLQTVLRCQEEIQDCIKNQMGDS